VFVAFRRKFAGYALLGRWRFGHNSGVMLFQKEKKEKHRVSPEPF
jgi:hypothetical protein